MSTEDQNPFEEDDVVEVEQFCWRDSSRLCSGECVAYDEKCEGDARWLPCVLLNTQRAQAKSFANIAAELKRHNDRESPTNIATELKRYNDRKSASDEGMRDALSHIRETQKEPGFFARGRKFTSKEESDAYAQKLKEMDQPPPEIKV